MKKLLCLVALVLGLNYCFAAEKLLSEAKSASGGSEAKSASGGGLVGYWKFDEGSGDTVKDSSGKKYDGQLTGSLEWTEGKIGKALLFDGSAWVEIPGTQDLSLAKGFSIEAWVYPTEIESWRFIVNKQDEYQLRIDPPQEGNQFDILLFSDGGWEPRVSNTVVPLEKWSHIVAAWDGENLQLWVNGNKNEKERKIEPNSTENPVLIGSGFIGKIDEVRIYNRVLEKAEILEHYQGKAAK